MALKHFLLPIGAILLLSGCGVFTPYHAPIDQGEKFTDNAMSQIKPGMDKAQVRYLLGTPNVVDPFDKNTWYYVYTYKTSGMEMSESQYIVHFDKDGKLTRIAGNYPPPSEIRYTTYHSE